MANLNLKPNPDNPRTISEESFERLKGKIERNPDGLSANNIVHKDGIIIAGNQRWRALQELKLELQDDWFKDVSGWTPEQIREYLVTSNVSDGDWSWDTLLNEYEPLELSEWGLEVPDWKDEAEVEEDEAPEVSSEPPVSQLGSIYQLGRHFVMCGDSTDFGLLSDLMNGVQADMVFTDPPYGVSYEGKTKDKLKIQNDTNTNTFAEVLPNLIANTKAGAAFYVCCPPGNNFKDFFLPFEEYCHLSATIIWAKNSLVMGHGDYHYKHEPILYGWNKEGTHKFYGDRSQTTIWEIDRPTKSKEHPTMKPIALVARAINNSTKSGDVVLDLFLGSGSTLIACEQTDRTCYGMEIDPKYMDVIRKRYAKFTNNNELPDNWGELTPAISVKEQ